MSTSEHLKIIFLLNHEMNSCETSTQVMCLMTKLWELRSVYQSLRGAKYMLYYA